MSGICMAHIACGSLSASLPLEQTMGASNSGNISPSIFTKKQEEQNSTPLKKVCAETVKAQGANPNRITRSEIQKINSMVMPMIFMTSASGEEIHAFLKQYDEQPEKQAKMIADMIEISALGMGTNEVGMSAAVYYINEKTYPLVVKEFAQKGTSIEAMLNDELSETESKDLFRHLNQFKK